MGNVVDVLLPDIGDFDAVDVIEILVSAGDTVAREDSLITLESDKSTMEIPSPHTGTVRELVVTVGDKIGQGAKILTMELVDAQADSAEPAAGSAPDPAPAEPVAAPVADAAVTEAAAAPAAQQPVPADPGQPPPVVERRATPRADKAHASPAVRRFARKLSVDLGRVTGQGPKGRILKSDVETFVQSVMTGVHPVQGGFAMPTAAPAVDFSKFGDIETVALSRIQKLSGSHLHRAWVSIPHVTQFDEADITELEAFRQEQKAEAEKQGIKLTFMAFLLKACVTVLRRFPEINASLTPDAESLVLKKYFHLGVAVDTPDGLIVPVIRDVDSKSLFELAAELSQVSQRARDKKLMPADLQGGTFSISSLGGIGGTAFTPIVNAPEVAILGVSRAATKPVYQNGAFEPRLILPLAVSYDHRVIDGATAARFTHTLAEVLGDIRQLLI